MSTLEQSIAVLGETALKIKAERDKYYDALDNVLNALQEARTALDGCSDINENGGPNWAMTLLMLTDKYEEIL